MVRQRRTAFAQSDGGVSAAVAISDLRSDFGQGNEIGLQIRRQNCQPGGLLRTALFRFLRELRSIRRRLTFSLCLLLGTSWKPSQHEVLPALCIC